MDNSDGHPLPANRVQLFYRAVLASEVTFSPDLNYTVSAFDGLPPPDHPDAKGPDSSEMDLMVPLASLRFFGFDESFVG
jgi:hypothetical protein